MTKAQTPARSANAAQPLGERKGLKSDGSTAKTGEKSKRSAGPDGPRADVVGDTFKS